MLRRLGVRGKILATLAVPVLVLFLGATILSVGSITDSQLARASSQVADSLRAQDALTDALLTERTAAFDYTLGRDDAEQIYQDAQIATDILVGRLNSTVADIDVSPLDDRLVKALEDARGARSELTAIRGLFVEGRTASPRNVEDRYGAVIDAQLDVGEVAADRMSDRDLGRLFSGYNSVANTINRTSLDTKLAEILLEDEMNGLVTDRAKRTLSIEITNGDSTRQQSHEVVRQLGLPGVLMPVETTNYALLRGALGASTSESMTVTARKAWPELAETEIAAMVPVRDEIRDQTITGARNNSTTQTQQTIVTIAIVLLGLTASIVVALLIARRITEPLLRLTAAVTHVREELPKLIEQVAEPGKGPEMDFDRIPIEANDEIGSLAEAFNEVNATTMDIAREQAVLRGSIAEMFVNVARRDQVLLSRQLAFLDELERSEEDPNTLANLFRLDHLATRMRRNAESLLVLAGIESGRRVREPMPLSDVIRTASSEIEQYDRIELQIQTDPYILGHNALIAAHLLAELLENATVFSDPGSPVYVSESEDSRWVSIVVRDYGLGMTLEEIDEANEKASTYSAGEIAGASRLGLYVVGRLSYRLGANVRFSNFNHEGRTGIEVRVMLPRELFLADADLPLPEPTDPLSAQTRAATDAWVAPEPISEAGTLQSRNVDVEPPAGIPVDLPSLTDGATAAGMPRRRARTVDRAATTPSESFPTANSDQDVVLPPLASAELPSTFTDGADDAWKPVAVPEPLGSGLPTRTPVTSVEPFEGDVGVVASAPVPKRASMFSNFRTRKDLDAVAENSALPTPDEVATQTPSSDLDPMSLPTRTARRKAISALSAMTGEQSIVSPPFGQNSQQAAPQFVIPGLVEDVPTYVVPEDDVSQQFEVADQDGHIAEQPVTEEFQGDIPADQGWPHPDESFAAESTDQLPTDVAAQELGEDSGPFNGMMPAAAVAPLPDFSEVVGRSARREAAESERRGLFGFGRRKKTKRPSAQAAEPAFIPPEFVLPDRSQPAPLTGFTPPTQGQEADFTPGSVANARTFEPAPQASFEPAGAPAFAPVQGNQFFPEQASAPSAPSAPSSPSVPSTSTPMSAGGFEPVAEARSFTGKAAAGFFQATRKPATEAADRVNAPSDGLPTRTPEVERPSVQPENALILPETNFEFTPEVQEQSWAPSMAFDEQPLGEAASGSFDPSAQLALRAGIHEQALSELSQLSSYRPNEFGTGAAAGLTKRVRSDVPDSTDNLNSQKISRDAAELRARLSAFVSATSRARDTTEQNVTNPDGAQPLAAHPDPAPQSH